MTDVAPPVRHGPEGLFNRGLPHNNSNNNNYYNNSNSSNNYNNSNNNNSPMFKALR